MDKYNIDIGTGIGKIEHHYGDINFNQDNSFVVRKDFEEVEVKIYRLYEIGKVFHKIRNDFSHLKNKEDFNKIYSLDSKYKNVFDKLYSIGGDSSFALYNLLETVNEVQFYPTLSKLISKIDDNLFWTKNIEQIIEQSEELITKINLQLFSINEMNRLHIQQLELLDEVRRIKNNLIECNLYKEENNIKEVEKINIDNAPEHIKSSFWFFTYIKNNPIIGILLLVVFVVYMSKDFVYNQNKHFIDVQILQNKIDEDSKIKLENIFIAISELQQYFEELKNDNIYPGRMDNIDKSFSALGFNNTILSEMKKSNNVYKAINFSKLKSKFEGHIDNKYYKYKYFLKAIEALSVLVYTNSNDDIWAEKFNNDWNKFMKNVNFVVPNFKITNEKKLSKVEAQAIYFNILKWLREN